MNELNQRECQNCKKGLNNNRNNNAKFCDTICKQRYYWSNKPKTESKCKQCNTTIDTINGKKYCSATCQDKYYQQIKIKKSIEKFPEGITCAICGMKGNSLHQHITSIHNITLQEYKETYNVPICSESYLKKLSEKIKGDKNPAYQHGGKFSPFSKKFIHADKINIEDLVKKAQKSREDNNSETTKITYYTSRGATEEEAKKLLSERQSTFSLKICIEKHGELEGRRIWNERQTKWLKSFPKNNYSLVSQRLFDSIVTNLDTTHIYYATLKKDDSNKPNYEYTISLNEISLKPDFIDVSQKKIIEFYGDYWHSEGRGNVERDRKRIEHLTNNGYEVLIVLERNYNQNPELEIKKCLEFLSK